MRRRKPPMNSRKVMLWPENKFYFTQAELKQTQRVPLIKFACSGTGKIMVYFEGAPIILN